MATPISNTIISLTAIDGTDCLGDSRAVINGNTTTIGQSISSLTLNTTTLSTSVTDLDILVTANTTELNSISSSIIVYSNVSAVSATPNPGISAVTNIVVLTQNIYDSISVPDPTTIYYIISA